MDATSIIAVWKQRLMAIADNPPYVFRDTPRSLIEQYHRRLTTFAGYSESEVANAEARLKVQFPQMFRTFLREMAKAPGELFRGSDLAQITDFEEFRAESLRMLAQTDLNLRLPPQAVVILWHQGCQFIYLIANGGFDTAPMLWTQSAREPMQVASTFAEMVDGELALMETNAARFRETGGYYLTLHPEGGATQSFPALSSGDRPLDRR